MTMMELLASFYFCWSCLGPSLQFYCLSCSKAPPGTPAPAPGSRMSPLHGVPAPWPWHPPSLRVSSSGCSRPAPLADCSIFSNSARRKPLGAEISVGVSIYTREKRKSDQVSFFFFFPPFFLQRANLPASCLVIQSPESCSLSPNRSSQQGPTGPPQEPGLAMCRACRAPVPHAERSTHRPYPPVQSLEPDPCADPDPDRSSLSQGPLHTAAPLKQRVFSKRHGEHLHHKRIQRAPYPPGTLQCCLGQESCSRYVMKGDPGPSLQTCPSRPQLQL